MKRKRPPSRKRRKETEEDLESEESADDIAQAVGDAAGGDGGDDDDAAVESEDEAETAADKRMRLARSYLNELGIDENDSADGEELADIARRGAGLQSLEIAGGLRDAETRLTLARRAHRLSPTAVDMTPDALVAVSGGKDRRVCVWDVETCREILHFDGGTLPGDKTQGPGHTRSVLAVAVSDDGRVAASAGSDRTLRVWDLRAKSAVEVFRGHRGPISAISFRAGTKQLATASYDRTLRIYDLGEMAYVESLFGHGAEVTSVDALSRERYLSGGMDGTLRLWKVTEGSQLVFKTGAMAVDAVAHLDDSLFLTGGSDGALSLWGANRKKPLSTTADAHGAGNGVTSVAACRYSDLCASGSTDGVLRIWRAAGSKAQRYLEEVRTVDVGGYVNGIRFDRTGRVVALAVGQEPRLGRWSRAPSWKSNMVRFLSFTDS